MLTLSPKGRYRGTGILPVNKNREGEKHSPDSQDPSSLLLFGKYRWTEDSCKWVCEASHRLAAVERLLDNSRCHPTGENAPVGRTLHLPFSAGHSS